MTYSGYTQKIIIAEYLFKTINYHDKLLIKTNHNVLIIMSIDSLLLALFTALFWVE